jgi:hypothetical protein
MPTIKNTNHTTTLNSSADDIIQNALQTRQNNLDKSAENVDRWQNAVDQNLWEHTPDEWGITSAAKGLVNIFGNGLKNAVPRNVKGEVDFSHNPFTSSNYARNIKAQYNDNKLNHRSAMHNMGWKIADPAIEIVGTAAMFKPAILTKPLAMAWKGTKSTGRLAKPLLKKPGTYMIAGMGAMSGLSGREMKRQEEAYNQAEDGYYDGYEETNKNATQENNDAQGGFSFTQMLKDNPAMVSAALTAAPALIGYGLDGGRGALIGGGLGATLAAAKHYLETPVNRNVKLTSPSTWKYLYEDPIENYKKRELIKSINDFIGVDLLHQRQS